MRDLAFIGFLLALLGLGFRRPFLFVLAYVYIDVVSPQRLTYYLLNSIPMPPHRRRAASTDCRSGPKTRAS